MPTPIYQYLLAISTGTALGAIATYYTMSLKMRHLRQTITKDSETTNAVLQERLQSSTKKISDQEKQITILDNTLHAKSEQCNNLHGQYLVKQEQIKELQLRLIEAHEQEIKKTDFLTTARLEMTNSFKALSSDIFKHNSEQFINLARETMSGIQEKSKSDMDKRSQTIDNLLKPIQVTMDKVDSQIKQAEKDRVASHASLSEQIQGMVTSQNQLRSETADLVHALRTPAARGRWGEIQLKRVVEMAGMLEYCDFVTQENVTTERGNLRPDLVIKLPNNKTVVVDSKAVLQAYLEASEAKDEETRNKKLKQHAAQIRTQLKNLAAKSYWEQFEHSPEFVVLFLPGENFFSAALKQDPELIEFGVSKKVIIATPTTLIALLKAVSYGWRQERITENAQKIGQLGKVLHERIAILTDHFVEIRKGLDRTVLAYNNAVGSFESRVLVSARKFNELDPSITKELSDPAFIDRTTRQYVSQDGK